MADKTYADLDEFDGLAGTELVALHQGGKLVRLTLAELAQWIKTAESIVPASEPFHGVLVKRTSDITGVSWPLIVPWQDTVYDTDGFWSGSAPSRITIPAGITKVRLLGAFNLWPTSTAGAINAQVMMNGNFSELGAPHAVRLSSTGSSSNHGSTFTAVMPVEAGDYFELRANTDISGVTELRADRSWLALEVVEKAP